MVVWHGSPRTDITTSTDKGNYQIARSNNQAGDQRGKAAYHFFAARRRLYRSPARLRSKIGELVHEIKRRAAGCSSTDRGSSPTDFITS
jgi:hypothetical protein